MQSAPLPTNEASRVRALHALGVIGTPPENVLDHLVRIAANVCETPMAHVALIDEHEQHIKAKIGFDVCTTSRDVAICAHTIVNDGMLVVPDTLLDARFHDYPSVTGAPYVRFYVGVPLIDAQGHALGSLCVMDTRPRVEPLTALEKDTLQTLAQQAVAVLELRRMAAANAQLCEAAQRAVIEREYVATHDALTGLPNRLLFAQKVEDAVRQARKAVCTTLPPPSPTFHALLFIDLDGFKLINDSLGHAAGDELLRQVAARLIAGTRVNDQRPGGDGTKEQCDVVARIGGDEFTVLLRDLPSPAEAERIADRLLASLAVPFELDGRPCRVGGSIGIAHVDGRHPDADDAMREADTAMYHAKLHGKQRHVTFDDTMRRAAVNRLELDNDLRAAIAEGGQSLRLFYQPIVSLITGDTLGFEAVIRWRHPTRGLLMPGDFVPLAEESKLIVPLGSWVIEEACRQLASWSAHDPRLARMTVNVNVARQQLNDADLIPHLTGAMARYSIDPQRIRLEITESSIMHEPQIAAEAMHRLRALGIGICMDDFGTGYSSLSCLHRFPLDGLKIDRSFVATLVERRDYAAIVHAVMNLARNMNMQVTAEGIETIEQVQLLQMLECEMGQGFYFARPMPPNAAVQHVLNGRPSRHAPALAAS